MYYQVNSTTTGTRTSSWHAPFTAPNEMNALSIRYKGRYSQSSCAQTVDIWRWTDSTWVQLDSRTVGTTEINIANLVPSGTLADYVNGAPGNGEVRIRVRATRGDEQFLSGGFDVDHLHAVKRIRFAAVPVRPRGRALVPGCE